MDKIINDDDRITIGVREWAVDTVLLRGLEMDKWQRPKKEPDAKIVCEMAQTLEEYVLGGIKSPIIDFGDITYGTTGTDSKNIEH